MKRVLIDIATLYLVCPYCNCNNGHLEMNEYKDGIGDTYTCMKCNKEAKITKIKSRNVRK